MAFRGKSLLTLILYMLFTLNNVGGFTADVEHPSADFEVKHKSKIALNLQGQLFFLRGSGSELAWTQDYTSVEVLTHWERITNNNTQSLEQLRSELLQEVLLLASRQYQSDRPLEEQHSVVTAYIMRNLCFLCEMFTWHKVFFATHSSTTPVFYTTILKRTQQQIHLHLEAARQYTMMAELISAARLAQFSLNAACKRELDELGFLFLLQQAANFYNAYIIKVTEMLPQFRAQPNHIEFTLPICCRAEDWYNLQLITSLAASISLPPDKLARLTKTRKIIDDCLNGRIPAHATPIHQTVPPKGYHQEVLWTNKAMNIMLLRLCLRTVLLLV